MIVAQFAGGTQPASLKLRLPSIFWRFATVVTVIALIGCDPTFDRLWTAQAQLVPPPQEDPDATRVTEYRYDLDGRLIQVDSPEGTINYGYEVATGRLARTWADSSETAYSYDKPGRLEIVKVVKRNGGPVSEETRYTYTKVGSRETVTLPNGVVTAYQYDSLNRLTNLTHSVGGTNLLASFIYGLHATGRRTSAVEIIKTGDTQVPWITNNLSWQFDGMYRITNETSSSTLASGCYTNSFVYDKVGNRLTKTHIAGTTTSVTQYQYSSNDQLTNEVSTLNGTSSTNSYGYDLNGSLVSKTENGGTIVYTYSLANKLSSVAANGATNTFLYNDGGIRVRSTSSSGTTTRYLIDGNNHTGYAQVLEESSSSGVLSRSYVIGDDVLGQCLGTSAPGWLLYDGHGSTRQLLTHDRQVAKQFNYSAYGETLGERLTPGNQPATDLLYCGEQFDVDLQMYNLRARFYDPINGRFNQLDTHPGNNFDPQSLHKYSYCHGDPVNGVDPSGRLTSLELLGVVALIVVVFVLVSQNIVNYTKFFGFSTGQRQAARTQNAKVMISLKRIIDSDGEITFTSEGLSVGGRMGTILPGKGPFERLANLWERFINVEGWPSAIDELLTRIAHDAYVPVPGDDSKLTDDQKVELAKALLNRHEAFDRWLLRDY